MSKSVDFRETLQVFLRSTNADEAAKTLGVSTATLHQRLVKMRKHGVKVPASSRKNQWDNLLVAQLNSMINKHNGEKQRL